MAPSSWKEKRKAGGYDPKRRAKAERERFRRGKIASFKRLNALYLDGIEAGRDRHIFAIIYNKAKKGGYLRYTTFNTNPDKDWIKSIQDLTLAETDEWTPQDFEIEHGGKAHEDEEVIPSETRRITIAKPPVLNLPPTPKIG
ncbi:hypothetical protein BJX63DRAFT_90101 [Aspergillus granulosus]|uniref:Uncharacterized protein n=1 Tax=Aspergillus granulosus TaxID=176169 RepID=A0ABR4GV59_9EURO